MTLLARGALFAAVAATVFACDTDNSVLGPRPVDEIFLRYVAIGNSITAGYQSDGINDSTQRQSYARLIALQMHTRYAFPSLNKPGCAPPIDNFRTQTRVTLTGQPPSTSTTCALRDSASAAAALNNVAVPGVKAIDPTSVVGPSANALTQLILGGKTMIQRALDVDPTFASVWIGNNDVLGPAIQGQLAAATSQTAFEANYSTMIGQLLDGSAPTLKGVLIGVVQVSNAPVFFTAQALQNPAFVAALSTAAGQTILVDPTTCTPTSTSLIAILLISRIRSGEHPPIIACAPTATPPVGDIFVLDAAEQVQVAGIINGYNNYIHAKADSIGFAYYDPNTTLARLALTDQVLATHVPNLASPTATFGQYVSLDGIHPSGAAHIQIANDLITVINTTFGTHIPAVPTS